MKNLPIGVQAFGKLISGNYLYIDKTKDIYNLFADGGQYYFLSRPRRFGKSLLISTLIEIFSGNKELFKGLWIYDKIQWLQYPVVHIDCSKLTFKTPEMFEQALEKKVEEIAANYNIQLDQGLFLKEKFGKLLEKLALKQKAVVLIDEYDKPLIEYMEMGEIETAKKIRRILKNFYAVIKGSDAHLRFVYITGVSKFSKVSVFSDLNNLRDITLSKKFASMLGYTETEMKHYFGPYLPALAEETGLKAEALSKEIRKWYNGYSWDGKTFVYNPFSILNLFMENAFDNYWFSTGTPSFLIKLIKNQRSRITEFENLSVRGYTFDSYDIDNMEIAAILFQTGYLTIKKIMVKGIKKVKTFGLSYPNQEVRDSFLTHIFSAYTRKDMSGSTRFIERVSEAVEGDDMERFILEMKALFASIPYNIFIGEREAYYHSIIYLVLKLNGFVVRPEDQTNVGRIDAVLETESKIYIMEFKVGSAQEAMKQIKTKKYFEKFQATGKAIILMGVGFDPEKRNIGDFLLERL
ncbi:MAG: ATP-binding protein [bacterium]|nr:ATP-binding protein [bacterium]